jgi:hypothetical protein
MKPMNILIVWISINLMAGVLDTLGVPPGIGHVTGTNPEQVYNAFDPNTTISTWTGEDPEYQVGDPVRGIWALWRTVNLYVNGVPAVLRTWGVPEPITLMIQALWIIIWAVFAWEFISGRMISN